MKPEVAARRHYRMQRLARDLRQRPDHRKAKRLARLQALAWREVRREWTETVDGLTKAFASFHAKSSAIDEAFAQFAAATPQETFGQAVNLVSDLPRK